MSYIEKAKIIFPIVLFHITIPTLDVGSDVNMIVKFYQIRNHFYNDTTVDSSPEMVQIGSGYFYAVLCPFLINYLGKASIKHIIELVLNYISGYA